MTFVFDEHAGSDELTIRGESYKYLIKVRRHKAGDRIGFRNYKQTQILHTYELVSFDGRQAHLRRVECVEKHVGSKKKLHIGWCVIDSRSVEKVLPMLNELGVAKITFIYCDRSQKNFKPDFKRFERIIQNSMQQCGRTQMMQFDTMNSVSAFIKSFPEAVVFDFCERVYEGSPDIGTVLIGAEGGFSDAEREALKAQQVFHLDTPMVLRSETAAVAVGSKLLL